MVVPVIVPVTKMLAPTKGSPFESTTLPFNFPEVCAYAEKANKNMIATIWRDSKTNFCL